MKYILYPGYALTVDAPSMIEITALSDIQVVGATVAPTTATPVAAAEEEIQMLAPKTPVTVTVSPVKH